MRRSAMQRLHETESEPVAPGADQRPDCQQGTNSHPVCRPIILYTFSNRCSSCRVLPQLVSTVGNFQLLLKQVFLIGSDIIDRIDYFFLQFCRSQISLVLDVCSDTE